MRTSRIAKETSRFFDPNPTNALPRRITRASLARFAHSNGTNGSSSTEPADSEEVTLGSDIEDAVTTTASARKRKRTATVTQSPPRRPATAARTRTTRTEIKAEIKTDDRVDAEEGEAAAAAAEAAAAAAAASASKACGGRVVRKPARTTTDAATGAVKVEPPTGWEEMYGLVKEMRLRGAAANAAVDTMGCERLADPNASARDRRFQTLVALMLSSQTKDTVNAEAMARLRAELPPCRPGAPPGLNLENMLAVDPAVLNELIGKVGFHNNKTRYLKQAASILQSRFHSDIPPTIEGLVSLPGVGPKMAHLCMSAEHGWNRVEGVGVDVHVHRITNLWGWNGPRPTRTPEETRRALESWLPRDRWKEINWLLVGFGQTVCLPVGRRCGDCELGLRGLCRAAERKKVVEGRRRRAEGKMEEEEVDERGGGVVVKKEDVKEEKKEERVAAEESVVKDAVVNEEVESVKLEEVKPEEVKMEED